LEVYYRSACRVFSGCLASTPVLLLLLESLTIPPPLEITLNHQASHGRRQGAWPPGFSNMVARGLKVLFFGLFPLAPPWKRLNSANFRSFFVAPSPLENFLPTPLYQALTFYERALRLPAGNFPLQQLASRPVQHNDNN